MTNQMIAFTDGGPGPVYVITAELLERILEFARETQTEVTQITFADGIVDVKSMCRECFDKLALPVAEARGDQKVWGHD